MKENASLLFESDNIHADDEQNGRVALAMCLEFKREINARENFWRCFAALTVMMVLMFTAYFWEKTLAAADIMNEHLHPMTYQEIIELERENVHLRLMLGMEEIQTADD